MADSLKDLLHNRDFEEPREVRIIKSFIKEKFDADAAISIGDRQIIIEVKGSGLAGALRMHLHQMQKLCGPEKRLSIRII